MDNSSGLQARLTAIARRKALEADVQMGVRIDRLSKNYKLRTVTIEFCERRNGLVFTPPPKKAENGKILFSSVHQVRKLPPRSFVHRKANLGPFQHCLEISSRSGVTWYFVCTTEMDLNAWHDLVAFHAARHRASRKIDPLTALIEAKWTEAKKERPDSVTFSEAVDVVHRSFGDVPASLVEERFRAVDRDHNVRLDFEEFFEFFRTFCDHPELRPLFASLVRNPEGGMTRVEFTDFLCAQGDLGEISTSSGTYTQAQWGDSQPSLAEQCSQLTSSGLQAASSKSTYANSIFDSFELPPEGILGFDGFVAFIVSAQFNSVVDPRHRRCVDPMDLPLNNYFINSSHNTFLTGDQLRSNSSTNQYRDVLVAGCRCVEIDCWNGPSGDPIVYHGHTATSKIRFEDVIRTVNEYAFAPPSNAGEPRQEDLDWNPRLFPVILSLEVHTNPSQCATMSRMLRAILGDKLLLPREVPRAEDCTPANLKGKILVKWKANDDDDDDQKDTSGSGIRRDRVEDVAQRSSRELSACVTIGSIKTRAWGTDAASPTCVQSYVESAILDLYQSYPCEFAAQNTRMLSRTYPAGLRVSSSNYDPMPAWRVGVHMVALNHQTRDRPMLINNGFFGSQNGGCGYVLKPIHLRDPSPQPATLLDASKPFQLLIKLICGAHLGEAHSEGRDAARHVRVWLHGREPEGYSTAAVAARSFHPVWNETAVLCGGHYDLDVLCLRLLASSSGSSDARHEVGQINLPVRVLRRGYRAIPLNHPNTELPFDFATIVCHVDVKMI